MQKKWKESVKYRLHSGEDIEKGIRNTLRQEVGAEWLGEEENLGMTNRNVTGIVNLGNKTK